MRFACYGLVLLGLVPLAGCGSQADALVKKQIDGMNKTADAIESGASEDEIKRLTEELTKTGEALDALKLSDAEKKALVEKYKEEAEKAGKRLTNAMMKRMSEAMSGAFGEMMKNMPQPPIQPPQMPPLPMPQPPTP